jgi:TP901 family phage tail tape measure protein
MAAIRLDIAGDTRQLDRDIQKTVNRTYAINLKTKGDQPLGRITGQVNEFNKSLDASNARVIAFGASAGIIFGVERAFGALVQATIEVQKSLQDINVILNASQSQLQAFGSQLFSIAKNTGQSFQEVAKAATEFSRQGLGIEETLKRTSEALILSRLSGLDAAKSVEALTAAVNSFASQAVTATEVVNKFATVDAAFAVSSADLADAVARVGSSAAQSGVSLNELIAIVTSAQQTTARGGAVIGNSFKTIFTRLQREKVVDLLESLGISSTDGTGQVKSTIQLLKDLGSVYDNLGSQQQAYVAEQVGGVFQINILKAALADLGKEYSIYSSALNVASGATDQAITRNEELNKTYAAQVNALQENARQLASAAGERLLGPSIDRLVGGTNNLLEGFGEGDGQGIGATIGKGILDGLGQFISGPGLALIGGVLLKLFSDLGKFATGSVKQLLGLNTAATQQRDLQASIQQILAKNPQLLQLALQGEQGLNQAASQLLANLQKQTVELQKQAQVAAQISKAFVSQAGVRVAGGVPVAPTRPTKASGYVPNFALGKDKMAETVGAYQAGYKPGKIFSKRLFDGQGGSFMATVNGAESINTVVGPNGNKGTFVTPPNAARGYVPNFARDQFTISGITAREPLLGKIDKISDKEEDSLENEAKNLISKFAAQYTNNLQPLGRSVSQEEIKKGFNTVAGAKGALNGLIGSIFEVGITSALDYRAAAREKGGDFDVRGGANLGKVQELFGISTPLADFKVNAGGGNVSSFIDKILKEEGAGKFDDQEVQRNAQQIAKRELKAIDEKEAARLGIIGANGKGIPGKEWFPSGTGRGFDLRQKFPGGPEVRAKAQKIYNEKLTETKGRFGYLQTEDFRKVQSKGTPGQLEKGSLEKPAAYWASKYGYLVPPLAKPGAGTPIRYSPGKNAARGYIPNFELTSQINDAINRETAAGIPQNQIYLAQEKALTSANPMGVGVFNKLQEPNKKTRKQAMRQKGFASGYVPNFAIEDPDVQGTSVGTGVAAVTAQLGFLALGLQGSGREYKQTLEELTEKNKEQGKVTNRLTDAQRNNLRLQVQQGRMKVADYIKRVQAPQSFAPTAGQKIGAGLQSGAFALSLGAPIIAETIKNAIGQETAGDRRTGDVVSGVGQIASFAGIGASFGPWGAAIGAATGAVLTIPSVIESFVSDFPELQRAAQKAAQEVTRFGDASSRVLQASESYAQALSNSQSSPETINKSQQALAQALDEIPAQYRDQVAAAAGEGRVAEVTAQIQQKLLKEAEVKAGSARLGKTIGEAKGQKFNQNAVGLFTSPASTIFGKNAFTNTIDSLNPLNFANKVVNRDFNSNISDQFDPAKVIGGKENFDAIEAITKQALTGGEFTDEVVKSLEKIPIISTTEQLGGQAASEGQLEIKNIDEFRKFLESTGKFTPPQIGDFVTKASLSNAAFEKTISMVDESIRNVKTEATLTNQATKDAAASQREYLKNVEAARAEIDAQISALDKNVAIQNLLTRSLEVTGESFRSFAADIQNAELDAKASTLERIVGSETTPAMQLRAQSNIAGLNEQKRATEAASGIEFKEELRGILEQPFQENIDKLLGDLGTTKDGFKGDKDEIKKQTTDIVNNTKSEYLKLQQVMSSMEGLMQDFLSGQASSEQLLEGAEAELKKVGIETGRGSQISDKVKTTIAKFSAKSIQEYVRAFQQRGKLAQETKQAILQNKINQALGVFGGFEGFLNRPEQEAQARQSGQPANYIERINPDLQRIEDIRSSSDFRYNNPESVAARAEQRPDLGRSFGKVYSELITQSGGAFREFIQKTVDAGRQVTEGGQIRYRDRFGTEQTGSGAVGALGGFDDIVLGLKQEIENQLKLAEEKIQVTTDPVLKRDLQGFIDSVRNLPGGAEGIARLQTMQGLGVARQSDYSALYGEFESQSLEKLKEISPELAASLEDAISLSDDPLVAEAQLQSNLQGQMIGYLGPIQDAILQIAKLGGTGTGGAPAEIAAFKPTLTPEQEARAALFREQNAKKDAEKPASQTQQKPKDTQEQEQQNINTQVQRAQQKAIPQQNKTIAEIEAETKARRDQKYLTSPLAPRNRETGKNFESIDQVKAEMQKALTLSAVNPEQKDYYNVLKNFLQNLNPTGGQYGSTDGRRAMFMYDNMNPEVTQPRIQEALDKNEPKQPETVTQDVSQSIQQLNQLTTQLGTFGTNLSNIFQGLNLENLNLGSNISNLTPVETDLKKVEEPQINQESFTSIEASLDNNSTAVSTLSTNVQTLNTSISTLITTFANNKQNTPNANNSPLAPSVPTPAPATASANIGPFNTVVNGTIGGDFDSKLNNAINTLRREIYDRLEIKTPPQQR